LWAGPHWSADDEFWLMRSSPNVMNCVEFGFNRPRGFGSVRGQFWRIAIDWPTRPYNIASTTVQQVITDRTAFRIENKCMETVHNRSPTLTVCTKYAQETTDYLTSNTWQLHAAKREDKSIFSLIIWSFHRRVTISKLRRDITCRTIAHRVENFTLKIRSKYTEKCVLQMHKAPWYKHEMQHTLTTTDGIFVVEQFFSTWQRCS
jgi:hypothetical protein